MALFLSAAGGVRAQNTLGQRIGVVQNAMGLAVPSAQITVCTQAAQITITTTPPFTQPCTPLFPIFSDPAAQFPITQPLVSNGDGNYTYWGTPGSYVQECIEAIQIYTYCQLVQIPGGTGGGGGGGGLGNQQVNFVNQTSVSLSTIYGTTALLWNCYDSGNPANAIYPANISLNTVTFQMIFSFTVPQSGFCAVNGGSGGGAGGGVTSFNSRTGAVVPANGDYPFSFISGVATEGQLPTTTLFSDQNFTSGAKTYNFGAAASFTVPTLTPPSAGGGNLGSAALPFGNLFIGTATGLFSLNVAALTTTRTWTVPDTSGTIPPATGSWTNGDCPSATVVGGLITGWTDSGVSCSLGGGFANAQLSNLSATAVNVSIIPANSGAIDLGSLSLPWRVVYANQFKVPGSSVAAITGNEGACPTTAQFQGAGLDTECLGDSTTHRQLETNNGLAYMARVLTAYKTQQAAGNASISATTIFTATATPAVQPYRFSAYVDETVVGSGGTCASNTTVAVNVIYTDPNASSTTTVTIGTFTISGAGTVGNNAGFIGQPFLAKPSTNIQFSTTFTGGNCTTQPTVQLTPFLEML